MNFSFFSFDIIVFPQGSWNVHVCCLHLKMEFRSCARGRQWCGIIHYYWWTASIKPRLLFSRAGHASWGLSLSSVLHSWLTKHISVAVLILRGEIVPLMSMSFYADVPMLICVDVLGTEYPLYFDNKLFAFAKWYTIPDITLCTSQKVFVVPAFQDALGNLKTLDRPLSKLFWTCPKPE